MFFLLLNMTTINLLLKYTNLYFSIQYIFVLYLLSMYTNTHQTLTLTSGSLFSISCIKLFFQNLWLLEWLFSQGAVKQPEST